MKISKQLQQPENWQDFETLCKELWGEIWGCPEIKKNGRTGQTQHGIDIYGIPIGEKTYYGIQCKGKDIYTHQQFTKKEITEEIEKAKKFNPKLKKMYFTTTAVKDVKIEEFIREIDVENREQKLFEVHLFSWEDIVDLIKKNKRTYDFYVNSINYQTSRNVELFFQNNISEITCTPIFKQITTVFLPKIIPARTFSNNQGLRSLISNLPGVIPHSQYSEQCYLNESLFGISLNLHNTGTESIEDYKIILSFDGNVEKLSKTNEEGRLKFVVNNGPKNSIHINGVTVEILPAKGILVGDDVFVSPEIFIRTPPKNNKILVHWKLLSKDYKNEGYLTIVVIPEIKRQTIERLVDPIEARKKQTEIGEIEEVHIPINCI